MPLFILSHGLFLLYDLLDAMKHYQLNGRTRRRGTRPELGGALY